MRILQVNKYYQLTGGGDRFFFDTIYTLEKHDHQVIPYCLDYPNNLDTPYKRFFASGITGKTINAETVANKIKMFRNGIYSLDVKKSLTLMLRDIKVDIAHLHILHYTMSTSVIDTLDKANIPIVFSLHDYRVGCVGAYLYREGKQCIQCTRGRYYKAVIHRCYRNSMTASLMGTLNNYVNITKRIYSKVKLFTVPHEEMKKNIIKFGIPEKKIRILENPFHLAEKPPTMPVGNFVLYFGQLNEPKGVLTLLEAAKLLPNIPFLFCGTGPALSVINIEIEKHNLKNIQIDTHSRWGKGLEQLIASAQIVVSPSKWPTPMEYSTLESLSFGKATLASDIGGNSSLIEDMVSGRLFAPGEVADLTTKLEELYSKPTLCSLLGTNAQAMIKDRFTTDSYYKKVMGIYNEAINH